MMNSILHIAVLLMILDSSNGHMCTRQNQGPKQKNARIYRGMDAKKNRFPWYIDLEIEYPAIKDPKKPKENLKKDAGGSLISKYHILTVAHIFQHEQNKK